MNFITLEHRTKRSSKMVLKVKTVHFHLDEIRQIRDTTENVDPARGICELAIKQPLIYQKFFGRFSWNLFIFISFDFRRTLASKSNRRKLVKQEHYIRMTS